MLLCMYKGIMNPAHSRKYSSRSGLLLQVLTFNLNTFLPSWRNNYESNSKPKEISAICPDALTFGHTGWPPFLWNWNIWHLVQVCFYHTTSAEENGTSFNRSSHIPNRSLSTVTPLPPSPPSLCHEFCIAKAILCMNDYIGSLDTCIVHCSCLSGCM